MKINVIEKVDGEYKVVTREMTAEEEMLYLQGVSKAGEIVEENPELLEDDKAWLEKIKNM